MEATKPRKGAIVITKTGKKGFVFWDEVEDNSTKVKVRIIDEKFQETGENLLCEQHTLRVTGYKD